ncbi:LruC domain-containing protein [Paradesertivirga mongoliensis]|uniref:LruC domain-containing protein n=1 Tax=Paradesertivirga mongoliensis TaxID=2100740 RepID=A0ABW4ZGE3_9SPHI|nr:LruC domain-containing protein [Pedobacter mongoliensis]
MKHCFYAILALSLIIFACQKQPDTPPKDGNKIAPDGFNFETSRKVAVNIKLLSNINEPLKGIIIDVNSISGETLLRGASDETGTFTGTVNIPSYIDTLLIRPGNPGLNQDIQVLIRNNAVTCVIGGDKGVTGDIVKAPSSPQTFGGKNMKAFSGNSIFANTTYTYMGSYDVNGRPVSYLDQVKGTVSADLLAYLGESLPDQQNVNNHHPQYLTDNATEHLNITKTSDVWVTFVSEGGGNKNAIGYYTYLTNNPPNVVNKIDEVKFIFPNASAVSSGGNMQSGDRVKIGRFDSGTSIGFVLVQNGWRQNLNTVNSSALKFYSDSKFNPENSNELKTHTVLLNFAKENLFVIGFEDLKRDLTGTDHDFNDVVLYATSAPVDAISTVGVQGIVPPKDTDADGVWDVYDKFPNDGTKAYVSYFPSENSQGTLVFEDNWPSKGDYDMNDLVVKYRYTYISNASNKVVEMTADFRAVSAWATNKNGMGVQLPFAASLISSVSGHKITDHYITLNPNGTEAGQSKAVLIPFDDHTNLLSGPNQVVDTVSLVVKFASPVDLSAVGTGPYNPFLICNKLRGIEAHLPGHPPTDLADLSRFGSEHDRSNVSINKYYISDENWPWALNFTEHFSFPKEGNAINTAYLHFGEWASSGGTMFTDWYKNTAPGYRDPLKIH